MAHQDLKRPGTPGTSEGATSPPALGLDTSKLKDRETRFLCRGPVSKQLVCKLMRVGQLREPLHKACPALSHLLALGVHT